MKKAFDFVLDQCRTKPTGYSHFQKKIIIIMSHFLISVWLHSLVNLRKESHSRKKTTGEKYRTVPFCFYKYKASDWGLSVLPEMRGLGGDRDLISRAELGKSVFSLCMRISELEGISFRRNCWTIGFLNHSMTESPGALRTTLLTSKGDSTELNICATTIFKVGPVTNLMRLGTTP